jgi:Cu(I)/Ag(I) efflux system membrane fusion protein
MKQWMKTLLPVFLLGGIAGYGVSVFGPGDGGETAAKKKEPLYWVAPMDPNYRRDKPGKSPMGMDLVPVYEEEGDEEAPGTVSISGTVQQQLALTTAEVTEGILPEQLRASGLAVFNGAFLEKRHSRVEGWITELNVAAAGDPVEKGDLLFRLYSPALVSAQQELLTALRSGQSGLIGAAEDRLLALGVSPGTVDVLKKRRRTLRDVPFYAGQGGVISELGVRRGSFVRPNDLIVAVGDPKKLWIEADLLERQAGLVKKSDLATLRFDALPGTTYAGKVTYIYPELDEKTRSVRLRVVLDNADGRVMPGMFAHVDIHGDSGEPVLSIPQSALIRMPEGNRVVKQTGEGKFRTVPVRSGRESNDRVVILKGLQAGDRVVTSAQFLIDSESSRAGAVLRLEGHDHD